MLRSILAPEGNLRCCRDDVECHFRILLPHLLFIVWPNSCYAIKIRPGEFKGTADGCFSRRLDSYGYETVSTNVMQKIYLIAHRERPLPG